MKLRTAIGISLILLSLAAAGYWLAVRAPSAAAREVARQLRAEFASAFQFQPEIRVESRTVLGPSSQILELATARREIWQRERREHEWFGSVKVFEVEGRFAARAGYDLQQPLTLDIREAPRQIRVTLPPAKLLGLELAEIKIRADADGWWNKLTGQDREQALAGLQLAARRKIQEAGLLKEARENLEKSVRELLEKTAPGFAVSFDPATLPEGKQ
ncbi:MAG TPA: DUF4230 domain-containing protein [Chthoniobacterales bacterium]